MTDAQAVVAPVFADAQEAYELLLQAVDLSATAHNALMAVADLHEGNPSRFWRKMHDLRRSLNDPRNERIRQAYVRALAATGVPVGDSGDPTFRHDIGEDFKHVHDHPGLDCAGRPDR